MLYEVNYPLFLWTIGILIFGLFLILIKKLISNKFEEFPYRKRASIMTSSEQRYYLKLLNEFGEKYFIFPQVSVDKLVEVTTSKNFYRYFNKINQKSVDFVLVDKNTFETVEVIELDDPTHLWKSRKKRDDFVNKVFDETGINLKRLTSNS